jgi:hypothetical protein
VFPLFPMLNSVPYCSLSVPYFFLLGGNFFWPVNGCKIKTYIYSVPYVPYVPYIYTCLTCAHALTRTHATLLFSSGTRELGNRNPRNGSGKGKDGSLLTEITGNKGPENREQSLFSPISASISTSKTGQKCSLPP